MKTLSNTGLGLIKATIERVQNTKSLFGSALKKLVNSSEEDLTNFLNGNSGISDKPDNRILRLLTIDKNLVIKATTGKRFLANAKSTFKSYVDSNFKNWKLDRTSHATPDMPVNVYEIVADETFIQIFELLSNDLDKLCFTQDQIEEFCLTHHDQLVDDGYSTFFLFKENKHFFVACVSIPSDGPDVFVYGLEDDFLLGDGPHQLVVPKL